MSRVWLGAGAVPAGPALEAGRAVPGSCRWGTALLRVLRIWCRQTSAGGTEDDEHPEASVSDADPHIEPLWIITGFTAGGNVESLEVHSAPPVSSITLDLLAQLDPRWRDPDDAEVLIFTPAVRYRIGRLTRDRTARLLHRIDDAIARLDTGRTEAGELPLPRCEPREFGPPRPTPVELAVADVVAHVVSTRSAAAIVPPGRRPWGGPLYRERPAAAAAE